MNAGWYGRSELAARGVDSTILEWRSWRRAKRLSVIDAAILLDTSVGTIQRMELGRCMLSQLRARLPIRMRNLMLCFRESMRPHRVLQKRGRKSKVRTRAERLWEVA